MIAISAWLYVFLKLFIYDIDIVLCERYCPFGITILQYKIIFLLLFFISLLMLYNKKWYLRYLIYILSYPLVLPIRLLILTFKKWKWAFLIIVSSLYYVLDNIRYKLTLYIISFIAAIVILSKLHYALTISSMIILFFFIFSHYYRRVKLTFSPTIYKHLINYIASAWPNIKTGIMSAHVQGATQTDTAKAKIIILRNLITIILGLEWIARKLEAYHDANLLDIPFILLWMYTVLLTIVTYSLQYYALSHLDSTSFIGPTTQLTFFYIFGSLNGLLGSTPEGVIANTWAAQIITMSEFFCGLMLISILSITIVTIARERSAKDVQALVNCCRDWARELTDLIDQEYKLSLIAAEKEIEQSDPNFSKFIVVLRS